MPSVDVRQKCTSHSKQKKLVPCAATHQGSRVVNREITVPKATRTLIAIVFMDSVDQVFSPEHIGVPHSPRTESSHVMQSCMHVSLWEGVGVLHPPMRTHVRGVGIANPS